MISDRCGWLCASSRGDPPLVDQGLDEGVVLGDLGQLAVAQQIAARVADMDQPKAVAREQDCGERGAHALEVGLHLDLRGDGRVAGVHRGVELGEQVAAGLVVVEVGQRGDHQLGGDLAGGVAAHPVGQRQQAAHRRTPSLRCWRAPGRDRCGLHSAGPESRAQLDYRFADPHRRANRNSYRRRHLRPVKVSAVGRS